MGAFYFLALALLGGSGPALADSFNSTTGGGLREDTKNVGGVSDDELNTLDARAKREMENFRLGRKSSGDGGKGSRYDKMEFHDDDFDGNLDHGSDVANEMEWAVEQEAIGKRMKYGDARDAALEKARCKGGKGICRSPSAILRDKGSAHGGPEDDHRVYELTLGVQKRIKGVAGQAADQALKDAVNPQGKLVNDKGVKRVLVNGQAVAPNPDKLRSEAAWIETQKMRQTKIGWKALRAMRFAGSPDVNTDPKLRREIGRVVADAYKDGVSDAEADRKIAQRVTEMSFLSGTPVCVSQDGKNYEPVDKNGGCTKAGFTSKMLSTIRAENPQLDSDHVSKLYGAAEKSPDEQKAQAKKRAQAQVDQVAKCMKQDVWCKGTAADPNGPQTFQGDIGAAFQDTREFTYHQLDKAARGPLSGFTNNMTSADLGERTDAKTQSTVFKEMKAQADANLKAAAAVQAYAQKMRREQGATNHPFNDRSQFDPNTMSSNQLFMRNPNRDGTTLALPIDAQPTPQNAPRSPATFQQR